MSSVRLELENIGVFRGKREFLLSKGLNLIYAPNASGKTGLISGLKVVSIASLSPDELRRILNDYEDRGRVKLVMDGKEYVVDLIRKPDGSVEAWGKRLAENGIIKKVAFIDMENELVNAIYAGNEDRVKEELREITGVSYIETALNVLEGLKTEFEYEYQTKKREYESKKEELIKQRKRLEERLRKIRKRIKEIERDPRLEPARKEIEEIRADYDKLLKQLEEERRQEIEINNRIGLIEHDYTGKKAELEALKERREAKLRELRKLEALLVSVRKEIEKLTMEVRELEKERTRLEQELKEIDIIINNRSKVLGYAQCPYCGTPIDKDRIMKEIEEYERRRTELKEKINVIKREIEDRNLRIYDLKKEIEEKVEVLRKDVNELTRRIMDVERELAGLERRIQDMRKEYEEIRKRVEILEEKLHILDKRLEALKDKVPMVEELGYLQKEERHILEELDYIYGRLRQLDEIYHDVKELERKLESIGLLIEYFSIRLDELKKDVVERVNETVLKHFKLLSLAELEYPILGEDFSLMLTRVGGIPTSLGELSDAEKAIFTILMTIALKDYVADEFPFYAVDSLIEFIDDTRAREVLKYLMDVGKNKVIIVTKTKPYEGEPRLLSQENILINEVVV